MDQASPYFVRKDSEQLGSTLQNVYVIYTPKIIKFVYQQSKDQQDSSLIQQRQIQAVTRMISDKAPNKDKEADLSHSRNNVSTKTVKIKLVSRRTTDVNSQNNNKSIIDSAHTRNNQQKPTKASRKLMTYSAYENSQSRKQRAEKRVDTIIPTIQCNLFEGCSQMVEDKRFEYVNNNVQKIESRLIILNDNQQTKQPNIQEQAQQKLTKSLKLATLNESFRQRKRIFGNYESRMARHNRTFDFQNESKSRQRLSIFQSYAVKSRSLSQNASHFKRKRIFKSQMSESLLLKQQRCDQISREDIPETILTNWRQTEATNVQMNESSPLQD